MSYYHAWYLSRELRKLGWRADVLNWDPNPQAQMYYHGEDYRLRYRSVNYGGTSERANDAYRHAVFFAWAPRATTSSISAMRRASDSATPSTTGRPSGSRRMRRCGLLKRLGKKIVYSNNGSTACSSRRSTPGGPEPTCEICPWRNVPSVCSDESNRAWEELRNGLSDYQVTTGGNRADWNDDPTVHEVPQSLPPSIPRCAP